MWDSNQPALDTIAEQDKKIEELLDELEELRGVILNIRRALVKRVFLERNLRDILVGYSEPPQ